MRIFVTVGVFVGVREPPLRGMGTLGTRGAPGRRDRRLPVRGAASLAVGQLAHGVDYVVGADTCGIQQLCGATGAWHDPHGEMFEMEGV